MVNYADTDARDRVITMSNNYELPSDAVPYILLQRMDTQKFRWLRYALPYGRSIYNAVYNNFLYKAEATLREDAIKQQYLDEMQEEFETIEDHLPEKTTSVLDVGCGVGGIDLFLSDHYEEDQPIFYLFDKTEVSSSVYYQFKEEAAFYNSLDVASDALRKNGVDEKNLHTLDADAFDLTELKDVDLVISLISWAFHYPLDTYLDDVLECLSADGSLLLDFRKGTGQLETAIENFEDHTVIQDTEKYKRTILTGPIKESESAEADVEEAATV